MADSSKNLLHSHRNALAESANPQPADLGVTVVTVSKSPEFKMYLSKSMKVLASKCSSSTKSKSTKC